MPSVYAELSRDQEDGTGDNNYQKLLKNDAGDKDTDDVETGSCDEVSTPYAELNRNIADDTSHDKTYQGLLKYDSDYVIPAENHLESP